MGACRQWASPPTKGRTISASLSNSIRLGRAFSAPTSPLEMTDQTPLLARIAAALERLAPAPFRADLSAAAAFRWAPTQAALIPAPAFAGPPLDLLLGVERQKQALLANTRRFAAGAPANNALLWGSRGTGKSALIKAIHAAVC